VNRPTGGHHRPVACGDPWTIDRLDLAAYLDRLGVTPRSPSRAFLDVLHETHVRTFTFDNIDVLLEQHPGVRLAAVQEKFVGRGRGGYCFEHVVLFAAATQRLGFDVERRLGRVGDPAVAGRTHCVAVIAVDGERWLADPGFGLSLLRPIRLADVGSDEYAGWSYRLRAVPEGPGRAWRLERRRDGEWEAMHAHDELPVRPVDLDMGHHFTSTWPDSHFRRMLMVTRHLPDRHLTVTHQTVTVRRPGQPTEHRKLRDGELDLLLDELAVPLTGRERDGLRRVISGLPAVTATH
jgi:N-hydroxyarylamine O-acetyltransferase